MIHFSSGPELESVFDMVHLFKYNSHDTNKYKLTFKYCTKIKATVQWYFVTKSKHLTLSVILSKYIANSSNTTFVVIH